MFDKPHDGQTNNDHLAAMLLMAQQRGFAPECVVFDSWYASIDNLRLIRRCGWRWLTQVRRNRQVDVNRQGYRAVLECAIAAIGTAARLKEYGAVRVFRVVAPNGDTEHRATNDPGIDAVERLVYAEQAWGIEVYHRTLKQVCHAEHAMVRTGRAQRNHIGLAIRAFVRLEWHRMRTGVGWTNAKRAILRPAIRHYLAHPWLIPTPSA